MQCKICNHEVFIKNKFYICENCGFAKKNTTLDENKEKERYLKHEYNLDYFKYLYNIYKDIIINKEDEILDFGCGSTPSLSLSFKDYSITNYDYYFFNSNYKDKLYDIIIINEVIEHLENPLSTIEELKKYLKDNGRIVIKTGIFSDFEKLESWWYTRDETHISFFQDKTMLYLANMLNLKVSIFNDLYILEK